MAFLGSSANDLASEIVDALTDPSVFNDAVDRVELVAATKYEPSDLANPVVAVRPATRSVVRESRSSFAEEVTCEVAVLHKLRGEAALYDAAARAVVSLAEEAAYVLRTSGVRGQEFPWRWESEEATVILDQDKIDSQRIAMSVFNVTFRRAI